MIKRSTPIYTILSVILFFTGLVSCNSSKTIEDNPDTELEENFLIHGNIQDAGNAKLYLEALSNEGTISVAECVTDEDGDFEMLGNIPGMGIYQLRLGESGDKIIPLTLEPKDNVELEATYDQFQLTPKFSGTAWSNVLTDYMKLFSDFVTKQQGLAAKQGQVPEEQLMKEFLEMKKPIDAFCQKEMAKTPGNPANIILSSSLTPNAGFANWDAKNLDVLKKVAAAYSKKYANSPIANTIANQVYQLEAAYNEFQAFSSGTKDAPEIALNNPSGKEIRLSSLKGKVVLIDFWASWCAPCRKESPNVVRMYNTYKDKGFTVYSVSLDKDVKAWQEAIQADGLIWPNHVSDLLGWESQMPKLYGFQSIPHTVLVDQKGKIRAIGLRGEKLEQKLKELLH